MEDFRLCMVMMASLQNLYSEANMITDWVFRVMANIALDGGSGCESLNLGNSLSGDLTVRPCSCIPMSSPISVPHQN